MDRVVIWLPCDRAEIAQDIIDGLRRGLLGTHKVEEVALRRADADGSIELELRLADMRLQSPPAATDSPKDRTGRANRMIATCELLDCLNVPNGIKAIAIALNKHWSDDLRRIYGDHDSPSTVKRWRIERSRPPRRVDQSQEDRRRMQAEVCGVRATFAARTVCDGMTIKQGYQAAIREVEMINGGGHPRHPQPKVELERFSYATFARDCKAVSNRVGSTSAWRRSRRT